MMTRLRGEQGDWMEVMMVDRVLILDRDVNSLVCLGIAWDV